MSEPKQRTALELLEHLLEVGQWYGSAIELDAYAPCHTERIRYWRDLLRLADEVGADRDRVFQLILADALDPFYQPPAEVRT